MYMVEKYRVSGRKLGVVNIGRSGIYGNPVVVGKPCVECGEVHQRGETIGCFRAYFLRRVEGDSWFRKQVLGLAGRACWCPGCRAQSVRCHGEVIRVWVWLHRHEVEEVQQ